MNLSKNYLILQILLAIEQVQSVVVIPAIGAQRQQQKREAVKIERRKREDYVRLGFQNVKNI